MSGENKPNTERADVVSIERSWESCNNTDEAKKLIEYIVSHPAQGWLSMINKAERGDIKYSELLIENSDDIYASIAEAIADSDGIVRHD